MRRLIWLIMGAVMLLPLLASVPGPAAEAAGGSPMVHSATVAQATVAPDVVGLLAKARFATSKYANGLERAKSDGYMIITPMIPNMGYHYLNPKIQGFDVTKPPILVYVRDGDAWQLVAIEWVFPKKPATPPLRGARYGSFSAACHYVDGSFIVATAESKCGKTNAKTGAAFNFWHPPLVTLHFWIWYPNPNGVFGEFNPLLTPFNNE